MAGYRVIQDIVKTAANTFRSLVNARSPRARQVSLSHRTIYIVPTKAGLGALLIVIILLITGMNYQNNLMYLFAFWLLTLILWNFILGFYNVYQLTLTAVTAKNNYEGKPVQFQVALSTQQKHKKNSHQIFLQLNDFFDVKKGGETAVFSLTKNDRQIWTVEAPAKQRGPLPLPRIYIYSTYPFGFAHAFSYIHLDLHAWVYPKPEESKNAIKEGNGSSHQKQSTQQQQGVDFDALKPYESGDKMQRIHWQQYAKNGSLLTKKFTDESGDNVWIRWQDFPYMSTETRLRHLSFLIQQAADHRQPYGIDMPKERIAPHTGELHKHHCLLLLAKYGFENTESASRTKQK